MADEKVVMADACAHAAAVGETVLYAADARGFRAYLSKRGRLYVKRVDAGTDFVTMDWFKRTDGTRRPWKPARRKNFVSLLKLAARDGDFDRLEGGV